MKLELVFIFITGLVIANIHYDNYYVEYIKSFEKHFKIAGIVLAAFSAYMLFKKRPGHATSLLSNANELIKFLPLSRDTTTTIQPFMDFASKSGFTGTQETTKSIDTSLVNKRMMGSGANTNGRSVSETKKKYVASEQGWKCKHCGETLNATFEVDHVQALQFGGTNHVSNLVALCRNCHGKKTMMDKIY
jgi:hypothetical protein